MSQQAVILPKSPTGIQGLDEVLNGGLPRGRPTLICGSAGCGKTLLAMEFLMRGATTMNEPGVFMAFEETEQDLAVNVASLGYDLPGLVEENKILVDYVHIAREEIQDTGEFDLEGLFVRLEHAIDSIGAGRVVLDTVESIFSGFPNTGILRSELRRLFRWLKEKGVTAVITGEKGGGSLTRHGLEEYVSDCVILLEHNVREQISTRKLRVVKYRGSTHGTNEYPFLIDENGIQVLPITTLGLRHPASTDRVSTGISRLDGMFMGKGYYRGSTILVSGTAGTGKSSIAAQFAEAASRRGERVLYFAFEESPDQIMRNMGSIGIDLKTWVRRGLLRFEASRPSMYGLEMHLVKTIKAISDYQPLIVIVDPINAFPDAENTSAVKAMLMRLVDYLKSSGITVLFTSLTSGDSALEHTDTAISSLIDTWLLVRDIETGGERNRGIYILKSRGMAHSNQIREFIMTSGGIDLVDVYSGPDGVLTGSARLAREAEEEAAGLARRQEVQTLKRSLENKRRAMEAQVAALQAEFETQEAELKRIISQEQAREEGREKIRRKMAKARYSDDA